MLEGTEDALIYIAQSDSATNGVTVPTSRNPLALLLLEIPKFFG